MFKKRDLKIILEDIIEEINRIKRFTENTKSFNEFSNNELVIFAVLKSLEIIGEAVKQIPEEVKIKYPYEWKKISGLRDILTHEYFGIDLEIIWDVINNKLEEFELIVKNILSKNDSSWQKKFFVYKNIIYFNFENYLGGDLWKNFLARRGLH